MAPTARKALAASKQQRKKQKQKQNKKQMRTQKQKQTQSTSADNRNHNNDHSRLLPPSKTQETPNTPHANTPKHPTPEKVQDSLDCPASKISQTQSEAERAAWAAWTYPPAFWDGLSELHLTRRALEEHNRRIRDQERENARSLPLPPEKQWPWLDEELFSQISYREVAFFARHGGPDMSDARGGRRWHLLGFRCLPRIGASPAHDVKVPSNSANVRGYDPVSTTATPTKSSMPYDRNFDVHLRDHSVRGVLTSQMPVNLASIKEELSQPHSSLSLATFSEADFQRFCYNNDLATLEQDVVATVIPAILGVGDAGGAAASSAVRNMPFGNMLPLTDGTIVAAKPDFYYGAPPEALAKAVRTALDGYIMPSTIQGRPLVPNFFLKVKGPHGLGAVGALQVRYDGSLGARAMHRLQAYGNGELDGGGGGSSEAELTYDGQAYTFSACYFSSTGSLILYSHHLTTPRQPTGRATYHMKRLGVFALINDRQSFLRGVTAFRNARDLAKRHRDRFIHAANMKAERDAAADALPRSRSS
ncbi:hypothetical protein SPI_03747 [Niveomyces insectorum RCEF 264]|uniref:Uncharacterized protein n=1 Tax=Niveomyces insectorum RCEF 264 TaxID=1081102 RepID=A0A167WBN4_9HYPO|nr:hypothetical protein SPI_03747 [Niveomyces insectorum RCEF 264]